MKSKTDKLSLNLVLAGSLLVANTPVFAVTGDTEQPIHIESDQQSLDIQGNAVTFAGGVIVTQGTIKVNADKVVVARPGGEDGKEVIDGYGNPVASYQIQDDGELVKGYASRMHYEPAKDFVVLTGKAHLEQLGDNITGDKIAYLVKEQKIQVFGDKDKCVAAVLVPSQLQDKNKTPAEKKGS